MYHVSYHLPPPVSYLASSTPPPLCLETIQYISIYYLIVLILVRVCAGEIEGSRRYLILQYRIAPGTSVILQPEEYKVSFDPLGRTSISYFMRCLFYREDWMKVYTPRVEVMQMSLEQFYIKGWDLLRRPHFHLKWKFICPMNFHGEMFTFT